MPPPEQQNESSVEARPEPAPARRIPVDWLEGVARLDELARMGLESSPAGLEFIDPCSVVRQRPLDYSGSAGLVWAIFGLGGSSRPSPGL